jgi:putative membrane protein
MKLLTNWAISAGALYATVWILNAMGLADLGKGPWYSWFLAVIIMAVVNASIRPLALLLTAPLNCLTFGLVGAIINGLMFALVPRIAGAFGLEVFALKGFWGPVVGAVLMGIIQGLASNLVPGDKKD